LDKVREKGRRRSSVDKVMGVFGKEFGKGQAEELGGEEELRGAGSARRVEPVA